MKSVAFDDYLSLPGCSDNGVIPISTGPIPTEFGMFQDLEILRLGGNLLTGTIPTQLGGLTMLQELYLNVNE